MKNLDGARLLVDVVKDAVRTEDDLTQCSFRAARISGADKGKRCENADVCEDAPPDAVGRLQVVLGDVSPDVLEVRKRRVGPDYLEVYAVAQDSSECSASS